MSRINSKQKEEKYNPSIIEPKWQEIWDKKKVYQPNLDTAKKPFYNLMMFPYPSAEGMHVGNMYAFTGSDVYGRFKRMLGNDVFEPIGLDGFGIHSENYALKIGQHPMEQAKKSQKNFYRQLKVTGNGFDWSRTVETYDPKYYKWTQWIFIQLFKAGLAYRKKAPVNFCPSCKTVLSDEQVVKKFKVQSSKFKVEVGVCERCETPVEKKELEQWFFRITKYADRLLTNLKELDWSEKVKIAQKEWIGKKEGINIKYPIVLDSAKASLEQYSSSEVSPKANEVEKYIECFTTRPDTNFGATFVVISPEHGLVEWILKQVQNDKGKEIRDYVESAKKKSQQERIAEGRKKTGVFTGFYCINNLNNYKMPLYISDFVLMEFGTGAVVGVPGHDKRDFEFAKEFNLPIIRVVIGKDADKSEITRKEQVQEEEGTMINSEFLNGLDIHEATRKIMDYLEEKGWGKRITTYHLRDWLISRQRYWGAPIPMIYCSSCASKGLASQGLTLRSWNAQGWFPVPEDQLPVELPYIKDYKPLGTGKSPLASHPEFYNVKCPNCGSDAKRETDVSDTFLDSAWYFFRYLATEFNKRPFPKCHSELDSESIQIDSGPLRQSDSEASSEAGMTKRLRWLPVTMYIGGAEHSVLHLLYSRFITMVFKDLGFVDFDEPFKRFYAHGLLIKEGAKMSKSKGNVVIPDEYIKKYGSDTLRTYLMFLGPFNQGGDFYDTGIEGMHKFLKRVWRLVIKSCHPELVSGSKIPNQVRNDIERMMHKTIKGVTDDMEGLRYNTAIAKLMEYYNFLSKQEEVGREALITLLKLLAPFAPHMIEELWQRLQFSVFSSQLSDSGSPVISKSVTDRLKTDKPKSENREPRTDNWSIHSQLWPRYDPKLLEDQEVNIIVQVNGKVRDTLQVQSSKISPRGEAGKVQSYVEQRAKESEKVQKHLEGKRIRKVVYVEGKVINFVI